MAIPLIRSTNGHSGPWVHGDIDRLISAVSSRIRLAWRCHSITFRQIKAMKVDAKTSRRMFGVNFDNSLLNMFVLEDDSLKIGVLQVIDGSGVLYAEITDAFRHEKR